MNDRSLTQRVGEFAILIHWSVPPPEWIVVGIASLKLEGILSP